MNKKYILIAMGLIIIAIAGLFVSRDSQMKTPEASGDQEITEFTDEINKYLSEAKIKSTKDETGKQEVTASINDFFFDPTVLKISKGTSVTWMNDGNVRHNVTSWEQSPKKGLASELLANGESYRFTFDDVGQYVYYCTPHPFNMRAIVEVVE